MDCSIIVPVHNEENNLKLLHKEINDSVGPLGIAYEVLYIDDGSEDNSLGILEEIVKRDQKVKVIQLARHFGQTEAMQSGIDAAKGDIIIFLDGDLQNDPHDIPALINKIKEGYDIASGWRKDRKDGFLLRKLPSFIANFLISRFTGVKLHDYGCTLKAYRKKAIKGIRLYSEMHRFIPVYAVRRGGSIIELPVSHRQRFSGKSNYNLMRTHKVILDFLTVEFITGYFNKPIYVFGTAGILLYLSGFVLGLIIVARKVFFSGEWMSPLLFVMFMAFIMGTQFILMGFLAEMFIRLYYKNTRESTYEIKKVMEKDA